MIQAVKIRVRRRILIYRTYLYGVNREARLKFPFRDRPSSFWHSCIFYGRFFARTYPLGNLFLS